MVLGITFLDSIFDSKHNPDESCNDFNDLLRSSFKYGLTYLEFDLEGVIKIF